MFPAPGASDPYGLTNRATSLLKNMLNELPEDILFAIVLHLGPSDLLSLKQVSFLLPLSIR